MVGYLTGVCLERVLALLNTEPEVVYLLS